MLRRLPRRRRDGVAAAALGFDVAREEADQCGDARHIDGVAYASLFAAMKLSKKGEL